MFKNNIKKKKKTWLCEILLHAFYYPSSVTNSYMVGKLCWLAISKYYFCEFAALLCDLNPG